MPRKAAVAAAIACLVLLRVLLWRFNSNLDMQSYFLPLQTYLIDHGRWQALRQPFSDYFPAYWECLAAVSYLDGILSRAAQIKALPLVFDLLAAGLAYAIAGQFKVSPARRACAVFAVLAGPTVIINGSLWGQCDILYTTCLMACIAAVIAGRGGLAVLAFGFALAFKLQSVFLLPFLLAMLLQRRIQPWHAILLPVGWMLSLLPVLAVGGSPVVSLKQPLLQFGEYPAPAVNAANPWELMMIFPSWHYQGYLTPGAVTAAAAALLLAVRAALRLKNTPLQTLGFAAVSLTAMPYILPRMHDRYFFPAELILSLLACIHRRYTAPALLLLGSSLLMYLNYFHGTTRIAVLIPAVAASTAALVMASRVLISENHAPVASIAIGEARPAVS